LGKGIFQDFKNAWFSAKRLIIGPKKESQLFQFPKEVLVVQYSEGSSDIIENDVIHSRKTRAGSFSWHDENTAFKIKNNNEHDCLDK
jgi:hypothetical protein